MMRIVMLASTVATLGLATVGCGGGDSNGPNLTVAFDAEFHTRPDGYNGLCAHYGFAFPAEPKQMDPGLMYRAVAEGSVDLIDGFATDGRIAAYDLQVLVDDKQFFPPYHAAPLVRSETLAAHPELSEVLARLGGRISDAAMQKLNLAVDDRQRKASNVAREFLVAEGLIPKGDPPARPQDAGTVTIGGKQFTEQEILGEMMAIIIEHHTGLRVRRKLNLGGTMICFNALKAGDLDLYAEYTGTGLLNILKQEVISDPEQALATVRKAFADQYRMVWLEPLGFNNTYTLTMRKAHAEELGIRSISDLAAYLEQ